MSKAKVPPPPTLPEGWVAEWDEEYQRYFYVNTATGASQWEVPAQEKAAHASRPAAPPPPQEAQYSQPAQSQQVYQQHPQQLQQQPQQFQQQPQYIQQQPQFQQQPQQQQNSGSSWKSTAVGVGAGMIGARLIGNAVVGGRVRRRRR
ncbi:hypothetical protein LJB42_004248 [Komagataella kurtzmanii]|nr:hypothetical protein LJB42_004248 [Komagataella kurtzmanii]